MQGLDKFSLEKDVAGYIKNAFDSRYSPTWHCIVGRNFGGRALRRAQHSPPPLASPDPPPPPPATSPRVVRDARDQVVHLLLHRTDRGAAVQERLARKGRRPAAWHSRACKGPRGRSPSAGSATGTYEGPASPRCLPRAVPGLFVFSTRSVRCVLRRPASARQQHGQPAGRQARSIAGVIVPFWASNDSGRYTKRQGQHDDALVPRWQAAATRHRTRAAGPLPWRVARVPSRKAICPRRRPGRPAQPGGSLATNAQPPTERMR